MSVGRHTLYNLAGSAAPMAVSILTVPVYLHLVGDARYGVLALVWMFLGYFGLFDPGLSRAAAYHIARLHGGPAKDRESIFWTALVVNLGFGIVGGIVLYLVARPLFLTAFKMPAAMRGEVLASLPWLAASIPISIAGGLLGGVLQAREWFGVQNTISALNTMLVQLAPLAVAYIHGPDLTWLIPAVLIARSVGFIPVFIAIYRALPLGEGGRFERKWVRDLFAYGGWIAISNLLMPILSTLDRLLIGAVLSVDAVAFYTVPFNLVTRISVIPGALVTSLFPKLSRGTQDESELLASESVVGLAAVLTPLIVAAIVALPTFMRLWVGAAFAAQAAPVGMVLLIGIWANSLAYIPDSHLQASNRPDFMAKVRALELLPFLLLLWLGLHFFGLIGAAWVRTVRMIMQTGVLFLVAGRLRGWRRSVFGGLLVLVAPWFAPTVILSLKAGFACLLLAASILWSWRVAPGVRRSVGARFGGLSPRGGTDT